MEPISITLALASLLRICMKTATLMYRHMIKMKQVSESIRSVKAEVVSLHHILVALDSSLKDPSLQSAVKSEYVRQHWQHLEKSLNDCQKTLERLYGLLERVKGGGPSAGNQIDLEASSGVMITLKQEIVVYRQTVGLSLNLIIVYVLYSEELTKFSHSVLMTEKQNTDISSRLDRLTIELQSLSQSLRADSTDVVQEVGLNDAAIQNLKSCLSSGGQVVSEEFYGRLTEQQKARLEACLSKTPESQLVQPQASSIQPSSASSVQDEIDLETHQRVVQHFIQTATIHIKGEQYAEAFVFLDTIFPTTETILGQKHEDTLAMMEMLAVCHCRLERWDSARDIMTRLLEHKSELSQYKLDVMHSLAEDCLKKREFKEAEKWCHRAMRGSRTIHGDQHVLYYKSVTLLVEILEIQDKHIEAAGYKTLVHCASSIHDPVSEGNEEVVRALLNKMSKEDRDTALIIAVYNGHESIVRLLLENKADASVKEVDGEPALVMAARKGYPGIVRLLLGAGADIEAKDVHEETALILAAMKGHDDTIQLLLEKGVDTSVKNRYGLTAFDLAERHKHKRIVHQLRKPPWNPFKHGKHNRNQTRHNHQAQHRNTGQWVREGVGLLEDVVVSAAQNDNGSDPMEDLATLFNL
jgi:uncharacterized protein